ncbi:adenyl-nucleotide exchange factor sse1 [Pichia californica]|uniref:Adenyl-nucleotide exchange factor sse1 n=1 Tax=Pichia californica TaxID=460514 RepID=A0A9P6WNH0_9ASCO|nr:adenyl-nucleotide exchange factor sse1 [[Candida] californica]KAG0690336.1 adenyl-nucleotide exchange factor sse1 [[Candida] californica]
MSTPFGVDLGNNNSVIAVARNRGIDVVVNEVSNRATPSVIGFGSKNRAIGESGKNQEISNLKNTVTGLKRLLGLSVESPDLKVEQSYATAPIVSCANGSACAKVRFQGEQHEFTSLQLVAMYLNKLKQTTEKETKSSVKDICLAVPVWYSETQRRAAADACKIAGLNPVRIVNEVTAAAVGYGVFKTDLPETDPKKIAFIDIGNSSYTCTIAAIKKGEMKVLGTGYDKHFGGRDFDKAITEHFADEFKGKYKIDIRENPKAYSRVLAAAEKLKKVLSANTAAPINIESVMNDVDVSSQMTRDELEELVQPLLARASLPVESALKMSGLSFEEIDSIELIGGTSRIPCLKNKITEIFGKPFSTTLNQDESIAKGAAFICAMHSPTLRVKPFKFEDINLQSVTYFWEKGAEDTDHLEVFQRGATYPSTKIITLYRTKDFEVEAKYTHPEDLPPATKTLIAKWSITGVTIPEGEDSATCKIKVRQDPSGFYTIEEAYVVAEQEFKELVEEPEAEKKEGEEATTEEAEPKEPEYKIVKKLVKVADLNVQYFGQTLSDKLLADFHEKEFKMVADDKLVAETEEKKNALEEYIYTLRGKLEDEYSGLASEEEKEKLSKMLMDTEDWLYDEGFDSTKGKYIAKYEELASIGNLIKGRYNAKQAELKAKQNEKKEQAAAADIFAKIAANRKKDADGDSEMK